MKNKKEQLSANRKIDIICLSVILALIGLVAVLNILQPNRPTVSMSENRTLAKMPEFSVKTLFDGSYFSDISLFISDTFLARDKLVTAAKKIDTLRGIKYSVSNSDFVLLSTPTESQDQSDDEMSKLLSEALDKLNTVEPENTEIIEPVVEEPVNDTQEDQPVVDEDVQISLSKEEISLTVGSGASVTATVTGYSSINPEWKSSDENVAEITSISDDSANIKAIGKGVCIITCSVGDVRANCSVTVSSLDSVSQNQKVDNADFLTDGLFIYGDAVYTQGGFAYNNAKNYLDTALYYKNLFGDNTRVNVVIAPVSSMVIDNPEITKMIPDQKSALSSMAALCDPSVNFVDTYSEMYAHKDDYLFFKTDHHWSARGAYYAYVAFAKSVGFAPTPLENFDYVLRNEHYQGSMYQYTQDERVKGFYDIVEEFIPRKPHTMTITTKSGSTEYYNTSIVSFNDTYVAFIAGDNPYTVINVPENPQNMNALVLKDSFGNAFVPFLCEHYGNIIVVDARYISFNVYDQLKDYGITDIFFVNNIQAANSPAWSRIYLSAVGIS